MSYAADLLKVSDEYRVELAAWYERGEPVRNTALYALLAGDFMKAIEWSNGQADLATVVRFLRKHVPRNAWGSVELVARWEIQGGRDCRPKRRKTA